MVPTMQPSTCTSDALDLATLGELCQWDVGGAARHFSHPFRCLQQPMGRRKAQLSCFRQQGPVPLPKGQQARLHRTRTIPGNGLHAVVPQRWVSWRHAVSAQGSSISSVCWRGRVQIRKSSDAGVAALYSRHVLLIIVALTDRHAPPVLYAVIILMSSLLPAAAGHARLSVVVPGGPA